MRRIPALRGVVSVFLILTYLLSGVLHRCLDLDVSNPTGSPVFWMVDTKVDSGPESGAIVDHHCHGCFAVSVAAPPQQVMSVMEPKLADLIRSTDPLTDTVRRLDPPPPKSLT
ncbi:hypothetical protein ASG57_26265 [Bradyrhizobium sp. Leaf396]|jgi:hypothetical protein|nr:hypothetical protein ASG57_26265 [Bradyrhizobium sp. Leaf396]